MVPILLISAGAVCAALSHISLKHGLVQIDALLPHASPIFQRIPYLASNLFIWLGLVGFGVSFLFWIAGLANVKLGHAYPILVGLEYSVIMLAAWLILGEQFASFKVAGIVLVFLGITIITL